MYNTISFEESIERHANTFHAVVPFDAAKDKLLLMNFTATNTTLTKNVVENTSIFCDRISHSLHNANALYGIGGYAENRTIYSASKLFSDNSGNEPRTIHLGIDIWGNAGTPVFAPVGGMIHSFAFNNNFGDYGATIILLHQLDGKPFYTLYGHLALKNIQHLREGTYINRGQVFAQFGQPHENGNWPPHLHFQLIKDMEYKKGDYPGVCKISEKEKYLRNCPNPDIILRMMKYAT